jgi:Lar family restriction alleviation protein
MIELKPCPFCGGEAILRQDIRYPRSGKYEGKSVKAYEVICSNYDCIIYGADNKYFFTKEEAIEAWNNRKPDWISVDDRLPEEDVRVLIVGKRGGIQIARSIECSSCSNGRLWISDTRKYPKPTHWMPLPEPPTLEGDE